MLCTFLPAIPALFIARGSAAMTSLTIFLKIIWLSAGLTMLYGLILTLSNFTSDHAAVAAGVSTSLLPIFYAFSTSLLIAPLFITGEIENRLNND